MKSNMNKLKVNSSFGMKIDFSHEKSIEMWIDNFNGVKSSTCDIKLLYLIEPEEIINLTSQVIQISNEFDYILTHNETILNECDNAILFEYGTCWTSSFCEEKNFSVSTVVGSKRMAHGHVFRHNLWERQMEIVVPKSFFRSSRGQQVPNLDNNPTLCDSKSALFDSMFHIVIENVIKKNWFTEKIIDTFQSKVVPIYFGCPNIGDWFDTDGMIIVNSVDEIISYCNKLTPELYNEKLGKLDKNFELSKYYTDNSKRVIDKLIQLQL